MAESAKDLKPFMFRRFKNTYATIVSKQRVLVSFRKNFNFKVSQIITTSFLFISAILSWILFFSYLGEKDTEVIHIFNWFTSGNFIVDWSIRLDALTTTMFIVVCSVSACVHLYSVGYMNEDPSKIRFMGYLSLFTFFMLMLVSQTLDVKQVF